MSSYVQLIDRMPFHVVSCLIPHLNLILCFRIVSFSLVRHTHIYILCVLCVRYMHNFPAGPETVPIKRTFFFKQ